MKLRKLFVTSALCGVAVLGLASCGSKEDESHTVTFYTTAGDTPMTTLNLAKEKFEAENKGWKVNIVNGFSYDTLKDKVTSMISSNTQPSLAYCYPDHVASYLKSGKVLNLENYINNAEYGYSTEEWSDFISSYMTEGKGYGIDGTYSIPMSRSTEVLYYNADVLEELNITVPTTWAELWTACETLKAKYPKSKPLGYDSEANWVIGYLEQYSANHENAKYYTDATKSGEAKILFNNDVTKGFMKELKTKYDAGLFTTQTINGSYCSDLFKKYKKGETVAADYTGCFLSIGSTGGASKQDPGSQFKAGVTAVPGITADTAKCISQGPSLVMLDQGDEERAVATWKFVKILLSPEMQAKYSVDNGYNPVRASVYDRDDFKEGIEDANLTNKTIKFAQTLATKNLFYTSDAFVGSSEARKEIGNALVNIMKGTAGDANINKYLEEAYDEAAYKAKKG